MQLPFHYQINLHWNSNFMTGTTEIEVHLLFDFSDFLLLLSVKIQLLAYQLMLPTSVQFKGCSIHTALSHQLRLKHGYEASCGALQYSSWQSFGMLFVGKKKSKLLPTFEKMCQNTYLHVLCTVIPSAELIL